MDVRRRLPLAGDSIALHGRGEGLVPAPAIIEDFRHRHSGRASMAGVEFGIRQEPAEAIEFASVAELESDRAQRVPRHAVLWIDRENPLEGAGGLRETAELPQRRA